MEITNQEILIELPLIANSNNKKLIIKRYQFDSRLYINLHEHRQLKGDWIKSKTKHFTFSIDYLNEFLRTIQQVRTSRKIDYESKLHIVHNISKEISKKFGWSQEYIINVSKSVDVIYISKLVFTKGMYINGIYLKDMYVKRFSFELPNKRILIKRLLNI